MTTGIARGFLFTITKVPEYAYFTHIPELFIWCVVWHSRGQRFDPAYLHLYETARSVYESTLPPTDGRLGGLYNNMALTVMELGDYAKAETLFQKALAIMAEQENGEIEMAITYCNLADLVSAQLGTDGEKQIETYLDKAESLLDTPTLPHDGYYAFVCEKCAPTFGYYGYFLTERKLMKQAEAIYERT